MVKFDSNNPDYLIYNFFGIEHLNYKYNTLYIKLDLPMKEHYIIL